jgi:hypothetical protein
MALERRVAAVDCGNINSGIIVADIKGNELTRIVLMDLHVNETKNEGALLAHLEAHVIPLLLESPNSVFVYENLFTSRLQNNWKLLRIQKAMRTALKTKYKQIEIKCLMPSQKYKVGGATKEKGGKTIDRKNLSYNHARQFIETHAPTWLTKFDSYERAHDVSDALLSILYICKT